MNTKILQITNILGLAGVLIINYLANALPINGMTTGAISDAYPNLFTPAGLTFSIWGIIYLLLLIFAIVQAKGLFGTKSAPVAVSQIGWWFFISCLCNFLWILAWHHRQIFLSFLLMLGLLFTLLMIYRKIQSDDNFWIRLPFSVYLGWISVATIANTTVLLVNTGWDGVPSPTFWFVTVVLVAFILSIGMLWKMRDPWYTLVVAWALFGIYLKRSTAGDLSLGYLVLVMAVLLVIATILHFFFAALAEKKK